MWKDETYDSLSAGGTDKDGYSYTRNAFSLDWVTYSCTYKDRHTTYTFTIKSREEALKFIRGELPEPINYEI